VNRKKVRSIIKEFAPSYTKDFNKDERSAILDQLMDKLTMELRFQFVREEPVQEEIGNADWSKLTWVEIPKKERRELIRQRLLDVVIRVNSSIKKKGPIVVKDSGDDDDDEPPPQVAIQPKSTTASPPTVPPPPSPCAIMASSSRLPGTPCSKIQLNFNKWTSSLED
jgi:hypothetical protein